MSEVPDNREFFERHPDIRGLQGVDGPFHDLLQAKLDLFEESPTLVKLDELSTGSTVCIKSLSAEGVEESVAFRRNEQQWVLLRQAGDTTVEEPVNIFGACASPLGNLLDTGSPSVRQHAYFAYAVVYPMRFRYGGDVPGSPYENYKTPEEQLTPDILAQHLSEGWVFRGTDGSLYWNEIDQARSGERVTGQVTAVEIAEATQ